MGSEDAEGTVKLGRRASGLGFVARDFYAGADKVGFSAPKPIAERASCCPAFRASSLPITGALPNSSRAIRLSWGRYDVY